MMPLCPVAGSTTEHVPRACTGVHGLARLARAGTGARTWIRAWTGWPLDMPSLRAKEGS